MAALDWWLWCTSSAMMKGEKLWFGLLGLAGLAYWLNRASQSPSDQSTSDVTDFTTDPIAAMTEAITTALAGWKAAGSASQWLPALAEAEQAHHLPTDLLARIAYQESRFREPIIRGTEASSAGALGLMQLMPQYFATVRVPRPFSDGAVLAQIDEAAGLLENLHGQFNSWPLAIAAYNAGAGNVRKYGGIPPFKQTQNYVAQVTADVPGANA